MTRLISFIAVAFCICCLACQQDFPIEAPSEGDVVFSFLATIDGEDQLVEAGKQKLRMDADYALGTDSILTFSGFFEPNSCENCPPKVAIHLRDRSFWSQQSIFVSDSSFVKGAYNYKLGDGHIDSLHYLFELSTPDEEIDRAFWQFTDGGVWVKGFRPTYDFIHHGRYTIVVNVYLTNGCVKQRYYYFDTRMPSCYLVDMNFKAEENGEVQFSVVNNGNLQNTIRLDIGVGVSEYLQQDGIFKHKYSDLSKSYLICASVTETSDECSSINCRYLHFDQDTHCLPDLKSRLLPAHLDFGSVEIVWQAENGKLYSSNHPESQDISQPTWSTFDLLSIQPYENDLDGQPTYMLKAQFDCRLYSVDNPDDYIDLKEGVSTFAVSYPY